MPHFLRKTAGFPLAAGIVVFAIITAVWIGAVIGLLRSRQQVEEVHEFQQSLLRILSFATDIETGQRGYLLTGAEDYLEPYFAARKRMDAELGRARSLTSSGYLQRISLNKLETLLSEQAAIMEKRVEIARKEGFAAAVEVVRRGEGKAVMDRIRAQVSSLETASRGALTQERFEVKGALEQSTIAGVVGIGLCALLFAFALRRISGEMRQRDQAERALQAAHEQLEERVLARTQDLRVAEESARLAREKAEIASEAKSEFLSRVSHELRTPLNSILGFGQLMEMSRDFPPRQISNLHHILRGGRHLLELVNELLDLTAVESGRLPMSPGPVPLRELIHETVALILPQARKAGIEITVALDEKSGVLVTADRPRLKQVLLNLLSNAVKFNRSPGTVTVSCRASEGDRVRLEVADTGFGLTTDDLQKIFTPFERLHNSASSAEGTGLGLILSKRLITAMGGALGAESEVDVGSTFWIELARADTPGEIPDAGSSASASPLLAARHQRTVLYIEDDLSNLKLIEHLMESRTGTTLLTAMQGSIGLDVARSKRPDLILLDLHLPDMDGGEVLRRLRLEEATCETSIVMLSDEAAAHRIESLLRNGANACLTKPLDVPKLLTLFDEFLDPPRGNPAEWQTRAMYPVSWRSQPRLRGQKSSRE